MDGNSSNWPAEYLCPISLSVMADPVVVSSGLSYERRCIEAWMDLGQRFCAICCLPLDRNLVISNTVLKSAIESMAKTKGMTALPSPPSVEQAYVLARRLIQKQQLSNGGMQDSPCVEQSQPNDRTSGYCQEKDGEEAGEPTHREGGKDDDLSGKMERVCMADESKSTNIPDHTVNSVNSHGRKGIHMKNSQSLLPPFTASALDIDRVRGNFVRGPIRARPPADAQQGNHAIAAANLEQRFDRYRAANTFARGGPSGNNSATEPSINSRLIAGGPLPEGQHPSRELPPHLVTKPAAYSSSEAKPSSSLTPSLIDRLVEKLRSEKLEIQQVAAAELRELSRSPANRIPLCRTDLVEALTPYFKSKESTLQINAVASLVNLSIERQNKIRIVRAGVLRSLVEVLQNGCPEAQVHAAGATFSLACADENKHPMGVLNIIPPLVQLLHTGLSGAHHDAAMALYHLSLLPANKSKLVRVGAVPIFLNLAQSRENPALASQALIILSNVASIPEGRGALLQLNAIPVLVRLLAIKEGSKYAASIAEHAVSVLVFLAENNVRFKSLAQSAGLQGLLIRLVEEGSIRARSKAHALLTIMKESSSIPSEPDGASVISRQYLRMRVDGEQMNSSAF